MCHGVFDRASSLCLQILEKWPGAPIPNSMKTIRTILQIPVLLLILYLGVLNLYSVMRAMQSGPSFGFAWNFYASVAEGCLEVTLLVWCDRRLGRNQALSH